MARYDDLNTKMIAYAAVLSVVVLVIILQATQALCYNMVNAEDARKELNKSDHANVIKREQLDSLNGFKKVKVADDSPAATEGAEVPMKTIFQIPIEDAQKIIIKEMTSEPKLTPGA